MSLFGDEVGRASIGVGDKRSEQQTAMPSQQNASHAQPTLPQATSIDGLFGWQNALQGPNREKVPA